MPPNRTDEVRVDEIARSAGILTRRASGTEPVRIVRIKWDVRIVYHGRRQAHSHHGLRPHGQGTAGDDVGEASSLPMMRMSSVVPCGAPATSKGSVIVAGPSAVNSIGRRPCKQKRRGVQLKTRSIE